MNQEPEALKRAFDEDGFVVVPNLLDSSELAELRAAFEEVISDTAALPAHLREKLFYERQHVRNNARYYADGPTPEECGEAVRQVEDLALFGEVFARMIRHRRTLDVLEALFGGTEFSFNYLIGRPKSARVGNGISDGHFHRDTPSEEFTSVNTILVITCLDPMADDNGPTEFIRGSHGVADEEARRDVWRDVGRDEVDLGERVVVNCEAGSGIFFNTKTLHATGHNRSGRTRHAILSEWVGPGVLPTSHERHAYQGLRPRTADPLYRRQLEMTFPRRD